MNKYDIATIRSRLIAFETARQNEAVLPTSPMPPHISLAHEIARELPHCELSPDFVNVWEVIDGEIYWDDGAESSDFWEEFRDDYHFPFLKDWSKMSELDYSTPSGTVSVSIGFARQVTDITITVVRVFPYADPEFEKYVDQFLNSSVAGHESSPQILGRFDHMKQSIAIYTSQWAFGKKPIAASLAESFARRHIAFRFKPELIGPDALDDDVGQLLMGIDREHEIETDSERLTEWGCRDA